METKKFGSFTSSVNENELSLRIRGVGMALIPFIIFAGKFFGFPFLESDLMELIQLVSGAVSAVMIAYGFIRSWIASLTRVQ